MRAHPLSFARVLVALALLFFGALTGARLGWGLPSADRAHFYPADSSYLAESQTTRFYITSPIESLNPDEGAILNALSNMQPGQWDFNPRFFNYPTLHIYTTGALLAGLRLSGLAEIRNDKAFYLERPAEMAKLYVAGRMLSLMHGALAIVLVALIARQLTGSPAAGAAAALLLAATPFWIRDSAFLLINVPAATMTTAVVWLTLTGWQRQSTGWLTAAAAVAGIAAGIKYPAGAVLLLPLLMASACGRGPGASGARSVAVQLGAAALAFALTTPYALVTPGLFLEGVLHEARSKFAPTGILVSWSALPVTTGPVLAVAWIGSVGLVLCKDRRLGGFLVLWFALATMSAIFSDHAFVRYWLAGVPAIAVTVAVAYSFVSRAWGRVLAGTLYGCAAMATAVMAVDLNVPGRGDDPRLAAARWIEERVPAGSRVLTRRISWDRPPVNADRYQLTRLEFGEETCDTPQGTWHVTSEPLGAAPACRTDAGAPREFSNPPRLLPLWPWFARPEDVAFTNLRIVVYPPRSLTPERQGGR